MSDKSAAKSFFDHHKIAVASDPCAFRWTIDEQGHFVYCKKAAGHDDGEHESLFPVWNKEERRYDLVKHTIKEEDA